MRSTTLIIGTILLFGGTGTALAETKAVLHDISQATFVANCEDMGGNAIEGESFASCELPSGTEATCSFEPADSPIQNGLCEVNTRVASVPLKHLLGDVPLGMNPDAGPPESLISQDPGGSSTATQGVPADPDVK
jgi:hypothetical protein